MCLFINGRKITQNLIGFTILNVKILLGKTIMNKLIINNKVAYEGIITFISDFYSFSVETVYITYVCMSFYNKSLHRHLCLLFQ